jgi:broad specificity phosphatase PhoE
MCPEARSPKVEDRAVEPRGPSNAKAVAKARSFAVVRHTERSDGDFEALDPTFPCDPTLSKRGKINAGKVASELSLRMDTSSPLTVVCSPFMRCVETGIEICKVFGCDMIIDQAWGEVMSPDLFGGDTIAEHLTRELEALVALASQASVEVKNKTEFLGEKTAYPETVEAARIRYGKAFQSYLERLQSTGWSFIAVTHGEALPVCLSFFENPPALMGRVPYGAYLTGSWVAEDDRSPFGRSSTTGHTADAASTADRVPPLETPFGRSWTTGHTADAASTADRVGFRNSIRLETLTLPLCPTSQVRPLETALQCTGESGLELAAPRTEKAVSDVAQAPLPGLWGNNAPAKTEWPGSAPPDVCFSMKHASPTKTTGLAARRRLRHVPLDLGGEFGEQIAPTSALLAAS